MSQGAILQPKKSLIHTSNARFNARKMMSWGGTWLLAAARPGNSRSMKTVAKSSIIDGVTTVWDSFGVRLFVSSRILLIIAVLVVATTAATKTASIVVRLTANPTRA